MNGGEFRAGISAEKDNLALVKAIRDDKNAIGFAGQMWQINASSRCRSPGRRRNGLHGRFGRRRERHLPAGRPLQFVINQAPDKDLGPIEVEFLRYVFSDMGQEDVVKAGFHPISAEPPRPLWELWACRPSINSLRVACPIRTAGSSSGLIELPPLHSSQNNPGRSLP